MIGILALIPLVSAQIRYYGGEILTQRLPMYVVFYGEDWLTNGKASQIKSFIENVNQTSIFDFMEPYKDYRNRTATREVFTAGYLELYNYQFGTGLNSTSLNAFWNWVFTEQKLPHDSNALYTLILDKRIRACNGPNWCLYTNVCGFHNFKRSPYAFLYSILMDPSGSDKVCRWASKTPNLPGVDEMVAVYMHELLESIYDPYGDAYHGVRGWIEEGEDYCTFVKRRTKSLGDGSRYNIVVNDQPYLIFPTYNQTRQVCSDAFFDKDTTLSEAAEKRHEQSSASKVTYNVFLALAMMILLL